MIGKYLLVFIGSMMVDIVPLPLPPAFTVMIFLQIVYNLNIWAVIIIGVAGSITGRFILSVYISSVSEKIFNRAKNEDVRFLGKKIRERGWKGQAMILLYSLMPLPTTPLFIAGGMVKIKPGYIIPPFIIGKFLSDMAAVLVGDYAARNADSVLEGVFSWQSISALIAGLVLVFVIVFVDWRTLLQRKKFTLRFNVWK